MDTGYIRGGWIETKATGSVFRELLSCKEGTQRRRKNAENEADTCLQLILSIPLLYRTLAFGDIFISLIRKPYEIFRTNKDSYGLW